MIDSLYQQYSYLSAYNHWIAWNLFLAFIPLGLSFYLFRRSMFRWRFQRGTLVRRVRQDATSLRRSPFWWIVFAVYFAFLPNAPYVLTDVVHLIQATWATPSVWIVTLYYIPIHLGAIVLSFEAYVISLINQSAYLRSIGHQRYISGLELITHLLCAIGIYLGRFLRFNSWDIVAAPKSLVLTTLNEFTEKTPLLITAVIALIVGLLYWIMKQVTIGLLLRFKEIQEGQHHFD